MISQRYVLRAGSLTNMHLREVELPPPAAGEVQVAVHAIGLNFADIFAIWGLYGATPEGDFTPGLEYSGVIAAVGEGVTNVRPGDRIMGVTRFGAYTSALNIDHRYVLPLPAGWSFAEGASYLVQVLTAYYALRPLGNLQPGNTVLIHSAAGGVGIWANRIAKKYNAFTIGTVGHAAKLSVLDAEGCDRGIVRSGNFAADLQQALGDRPLHLVLDAIGGRIFNESFAALAPQGRCVVYGSARYARPGDKPNYPHLLYHYLQRPRIDPQSLPEQNKAVLGFNLIWLYERVELMHRLLIELEALRLAPPHLGHRFSFEDLPEAVRLFQTGKTVGKVIVEL